MQNGICSVQKRLFLWPSGECTLLFDKQLFPVFLCHVIEVLLTVSFVSCVLLTLLLFCASALTSYIEIDAGWQTMCDVC